MANNYQVEIYAYNVAVRVRADVEANSEEEALKILKQEVDLTNLFYFNDVEFQTEDKSPVKMFYTEATLDNDYHIEDVEEVS